MKKVTQTYILSPESEEQLIQEVKKYKIRTTKKGNISLDDIFEKLLKKGKPKHIPSGIKINGISYVSPSTCYSILKEYKCDKVTGILEDQSDDQSAEKLEDGSGEESEDQSAEKSKDGSGEESEDQSAEKSEEKPKKLIPLPTFLSNHKAANKDFTHTSMSGGSWNIPNDALDDFYRIYSKEVKTKELHMTERHMPDFGPIVIDFDFKFKESISPRPIDGNLIKCIVSKLV